MTSTLDGGCSCRAIRYRMQGPPMFVNCCHCLDCQRQTGSAFVLNAIVERDRVTLLSGAPEPVPVPTDSGRPHDIWRCPTCRVAVWSDYGRRGTMIFVRVGTLDNPHALKPDAHIFTRTKQPWVKLPPEVPAFEVFYDLPKQWPAESLTRRKALMPEKPRG
jgi:hypothetical protein